MRLLYITSKGAFNDEAQKKLSNSLLVSLTDYNKLFNLASDKLFSPPALINASIRFKPDIIHVFLRLKIQVLCYLVILKIICPRSLLIISAFQPPEGGVAASTLLSLLQPDLTLTLSQKTAMIFQQAGCQTMISFAGIDTKVFTPVTNEREKKQLRKKYEISTTKPMVLHVGHLTEGRNLSTLSGLAEDNDLSVVIVASPSQTNERLREKLVTAGVKIFNDFYPDIEEFYKMADCYVFPTISESYAIELPLSVLEAMACNIPVVATKLGALPELFEEDDKYVFSTGDVEDLRHKITAIVRGNNAISNRDKVLKFDWEHIVNEHRSIYQKIRKRSRVP